MECSCKKILAFKVNEPGVLVESAGFVEVVCAVKPGDTPVDGMTCWLCMDS